MRWRTCVSALAMMALALPAVTKAVDHHTRSEIDGLVATYVDHFNHHDVAKITAMLTADAVMVSSIAPSTGTVVSSGQPAITTYLQSQFQQGAHLDSFAETQVSEVRRNVVMMVGQWHATGNSKGGHYDLIGHWTAVAVRLGPGWRICLLTEFTDPPTGQG